MQAKTKIDIDTHYAVDTGYFVVIANIDHNLCISRSCQPVKASLVLEDYHIEHTNNIYLVWHIKGGGGHSHNHTGLQHKWHQQPFCATPFYVLYSFHGEIGCPKY